MRISINHLNLGLFYEACIVCGNADFKYFNKVANSMNRYGVKTKILNYENDIGNFDLKILAVTHSVIFILNGNDLENAVKNTASPLRRVLTFMNKRNPNAISLATTDNESTSAKIIFPPELDALNWLHRKRFYMYQFDFELARQLCDEIRTNYSKRRLDKIEKLHSDGVENYRKMYKVLFFLLLIVFCAPFLMLGGYMLSTLGGSFILGALSVIGYVLWFVGLLTSGFIAPYVPICFIAMRDKLLDVSLTFAKFRDRSRKRLCLISSIYFGIFTQYLPFLLDYSKKVDLPSNLLNPLLPACIFAVLALALLINCAVLWRKAVKSNEYLEFSLKRFKYRPIALLIFAVAVAIAIFLINTFYTFQ